MKVSGVIDAYHRVFNYPTLHVVDGSTITANLGVNPSLTITAQAERAMSMWPNKGDTRSNDQHKVLPTSILLLLNPYEPVVPAGAYGER